MKKEPEKLRPLELSKDQLASLLREMANLMELRTLSSACIEEPELRRISSAAFIAASDGSTTLDLLRSINLLLVRARARQEIEFQKEDDDDNSEDGV